MRVDESSTDIGAGAQRSIYLYMLVWSYRWDLIKDMQGTRTCWVISTFVLGSFCPGAKPPAPFKWEESRGTRPNI